MIVGDSLTTGIHGDYTWRYRLAKEFQRQGKPVDFVGSNTWPYVATGYSFANYADPRFDHDHYSWGGAQLGVQANRIGAEVTKQQPDVIVLASGLNDLMHGRSAEETTGILRQFIANARAARPNVGVVVSPVLTIYRANLPHANGLITAYDQRAAAVVKELNTAESPVLMAPTTSGWSPNTTMVQDGIHATPKGEAFIAQRIAQALHAGRWLDQAPPAPPSSVAWGRNLRPKVTLRGAAAVLTWDAQGLTSARVWVRRRWGSWHQVGGTVQHSYTYNLTPGATYDFKIQGVRRVMKSTLSTATTIKAPPLGRVRAVRVHPRKVTWPAVPGATQYRVQYRVPGKTAWHTKYVRGTTLKVRASIAQVSARNAFTSSAATTGRRR
jgi:lysophospholipase L1-like esterase